MAQTSLQLHVFARHEGQIIFGTSITVHFGSGNSFVKTSCLAAASQSANGRDLGLK
jgi:hypothetical protein